jgi:hypothetical protein
MGFGAIIASGEKNELLRDDLVGCITEVRVEQSLDEPTHFAIRFQEDLSGGEPVIMKAPELQCRQRITIAVQVGDEIKCLVRGPITDIKCSVMLGGPGSWFEIHGQDRRTDMDRECKRRSWFGLESEAAARILQDEYKFQKMCIQKTRKHYGTTRQNNPQEPTTETLNQRATDEAFLRQVACRNNLHFWIEYDCQPNGRDRSGKSLEVVEIANLRSSPLRPVDAENLVDCEERIKLKPIVNVTLRVNVEKEQCQNVTTFNMTMNFERPSQFKGTAVNDRAGKEQRTSAEDRQPPQARGGKRLADCNPDRILCITTAGPEEELQRKAEAALTEAGWFIDTTASTTVHMLGSVLLPHDEVEVQGLGDDHNGLYQVKAVTHVINAADHFMDLQLRRNAFGGE